MDSVERLRQEIGGYTDTDIEKAEADMQEAADEIERLREVIENMTNLSTNLWHIGFSALKGDK